MKVFVRTKEAHDLKENIIPYSYNIYNALDGFLQCGIEPIFYHNVKEIYDLYELGDIVLDGIDQVNYCLSKFNIIPQEFNYPEILAPYLGRKVWKDTINSIASNEEKWSARNFVKPVKEKVFTGKTISSIKDLIGCGSCYEDYEVIVSEPLDIVYECRGFVYYDKLIDLRPYKGDFKYMKYMDTELIEKAMEDWKKWENRPASCSLDWGIVREKTTIKKEFKPNYEPSHFSIPKTNTKLYNQNNKFETEEFVYRTVLIEGNLPYALGCYGLYSLQYAKMISAYISQISNVPDELKF